MHRSQLLNIILVVFIVMLGFGLIMPLIPYYGAQYGASDFLLGLLMAAYAGAQFVSAPLLGRLSDRVGRRPILVVSMAGTAFGFLLLGLADPLGRWLSTAGEPDPELQNNFIKRCSSRALSAG
jgi:DHA1 family tetracycline resistance protein-like MFS transporter